MKLKQLFRTFLPLLIVAVMLSGTARAALLDFGPITPEVVGSVPPVNQTGFPLWFRDTNRVPLQLCLDEVPGCLFAAVDRPDLNAPLAFPNLPDELFYYSATALLPNAIDDQLLFAGVEMNLADNGDGTFDQVGFARVRIRISTLIPGEYTVTTPWKQYVFNVDQATITASGDGRRVINATEDIGLRADGDFAGILEGNVGPYGYSEGAPFVTAAGSFIGDGTPLPLLGTPNNIFRIEGPGGFPTVETNLFAVTGKLYDLAPIPTPLAVDRATYTRDNGALQVNAFVTSEALSNQTVPTAPFPQNFALTGAPTVLELTGAGVPTQNMTTNNPADGKFFSASGRFDGTPPAEVTVTNTADVPITVKTVPLVDEVVIDNAAYNQTTGALSITASSRDIVAAPALQAFMPGVTEPLGTLANGQLNVTFPVTIGAQTYVIPPNSITVQSAIGGSATALVDAFIPVPPAPPTPATSVTLASSVAGSVAAQGTQIAFVASGNGGSGSYEYSFWLHNGAVWSEARPYSTTSNWTWDTTGLATGVTYTIAARVRSIGSTTPFEAVAFRAITLNTTAIGVLATANVPSPQLPGASITFSAAASGGSGNYLYQFQLFNGTVWTQVRNYSADPTWVWNSTGLAAGNYVIGVNVVNASDPGGVRGSSFLPYVLTTPATAVNVISDQPTPHTAGTPVIFAASGVGGSGKYEYKFSLFDGATWTTVQPYSGTSFWTLPGGTAAGNYVIGVNVRNAGSASLTDAVTFVPYVVQ
jgi:hypothetical protein